MVVLCGFHGCGKSTVGERLSKRLKIPFRDTDREIERWFGSPVRQLYRNVGAARFRAIEREVVSTLRGPCEEAVISVGGGTLLDTANWSALRQRGPIIYLELPLSLLQERWSEAPAFARTVSDLAVAFVERVKVYQMLADSVLCTAGMEPEEVVETLIDWYGE